MSHVRALSRAGACLFMLLVASAVAQMSQKPAPVDTVIKNGTILTVTHGTIDGDRVTFERLDDGPVPLRMVWDLTDPADFTWLNEFSVNGVDWNSDRDLPP